MPWLFGPGTVPIVRNAPHLEDPRWNPDVAKAVLGVVKRLAWRNGRGACRYRRGRAAPDPTDPEAGPGATVIAESTDPRCTESGPTGTLTIRIGPDARGRHVGVEAE